MTANERARLELGAALSERSLSDLLRRGALQEAEAAIRRSLGDRPANGSADQVRAPADG